MRAVAATAPRGASAKALALSCALSGASSLGLAAGGCDGATRASAPDLAVVACPNDLPASCPSPAPSFAKDVQPIVAAHCTVCHSPRGSNPGRPFVTYDQLYAQRADVLSQTYGCRMPPPDGGVPAPSGADRVTLLGWLVCGAPDN